MFLWRLDGDIFRIHTMGGVKMKYLLILIFTLTLTAQDWPTYKFDFRRSGVTKANLSENMKMKWVRKSSAVPQTAWSGPAKWDAYSGNAGLQSLRNFDPAFFVTGQGNDAYFGSSVDNAVHCMDTDSGKEKWVFFTNGPVRFPPTLVKNKLYFGSDDGFVYCLDTNGKLQWKYQAVPGARLIASNGKLISTWPVRTGVVIKDQRVYFAASLVPWEPSYVCCLNAENGSEIYNTQHKDISLEGAALTTTERLIIPQGRASALLFDLKTGKNAGHLGNAGSTFLILTEDEKIISGPRNQKSKNNVVHISDASKKINMAQLDGTDRMIIDGEKAWYHKSGQLICINRVDYANKTYERSKLLNEKKGIQKNFKKLTGAKKEAAQKRLNEISSRVTELNSELSKTTLWQSDAPLPISFIKSGDKLVCGLENEVCMIDSKSGKKIWSGKIKGRAFGLASWNNKLVVSTDEGHIYCFGQ